VRWPGLAFAMFAYILAFLPTSSVLPFRMAATDYRQLPSIVFLAVGIGAFARWGRRARLGACGAAIWFVIGTLSNNTYWRTEQSLWEHSVALGATSVAYNNLALALSEKDGARAIELLREARRLEPEDLWVLGNLTIQVLRAGDRVEGRALADELLAAGPNWAPGLLMYAQAMEIVGTEEQVGDASFRAAMLEPRYERAQLSARWALYRSLKSLAIDGKWGAAAAAGNKLHQLVGSEYDSLFLLGSAEEGLGNTEQAAKAYAAHLKLEPGHLKARLSAIRLCVNEGRTDEANRLIDDGLGILGRHPELEQWKLLAH